MKSRIILLIFTGALLLNFTSTAQSVEDAFFAPELIEKYHKEIQLSKEQRDYMRKSLTDVQGTFTELKWNLQDIMAEIAEGANTPKVNEEKMLQQLEKVLDLERQIKRLQLKLLIRLKNNLTPVQQEQLRKLKGKE